MIDRREFLRRASALGLSVTIPTLAACYDQTDGGSPTTDSGVDAGESDVSADTVFDIGADTGDATDGGGEDGLPRYEYDGEPGPETAFEHGVASGDPLANAVVLWTRVTTAAADATPAAGSVDVFLEVSDSPSFERRVAAGWFDTHGERDYTVRVDLTELQPGTTYYYRFAALGRFSPIGRTKTAPADGVEHLKFAVCSCSNYAYGYFYAYRHMARRPDLDAVLHLGDYIYEYANPGYGETYGTFRELDPPTEMIQLDDYRRRYAHYRKDPDLQEVHRQNAMIHVWDDHEFTCDPFVGGAVNHQPETEGGWRDRVAVALQAYGEWMPTRLGAEGRIFRLFDYGDLARVVMLDRQRRYVWPADDDGEWYLGREQQEWLDEQIAGTSARWLLFGQGTTFAPHNADMVSGSSWDPVSRERVLQAIDDAGVRNLVVLTGDIHRAEALDIVRDPAVYDATTGAGSAGVELACNSISSPGGERAVADIPHFRWNSGANRGYLVVDVTPERVRADFYGFFDLLKGFPDEPAEEWLAGFRVDEGTNFLVDAQTPVATSERAPELAPPDEAAD